MAALLAIASPAAALPTWMTFFSVSSEWHSSGRETYQVDTSSVFKRYGYTYAKGRWNNGYPETIAVQCSRKRIMFGTERTYPEPYWRQMVDGKWFVDSGSELSVSPLNNLSRKVMDFLCETGELGQPSSTP